MTRASADRWSYQLWPHPASPFPNSPPTHPHSSTPGAGSRRGPEWRGSLPGRKQERGLARTREPRSPCAVLFSRGNPRGLQVPARAPPGGHCLLHLDPHWAVHARPWGGIANAGARRTAGGATSLLSEGH